MGETHSKVIWNRYGSVKLAGLFRTVTSLRAAREGVGEIGRAPVTT